MTEADRPAVDIDLVGTEAEITHRLDADRGKGLIDFNEIQV